MLAHNPRYPPYAPVNRRDMMVRSFLGSPIALANPQHLAKLKEGVDAWNLWREKHPGLNPDLDRADLTHADLERANLKGADLATADLENANLKNADLTGADLAKATLRGADLTKADLTLATLLGATLRGANLTGANCMRATLTWTNFAWAALSGVNFNKAHLGFTIFASTDLSEAQGLDSVFHDFPSTIGIDTLFRSQGKIPISFLRGAGVPENLITYIPSLTAPGSLQFYSCFISYSTKDQDFADRLHADLQNKGVRCWFAPHDVQSGKKLHEQIDDAIRIHERLLLILSPNSIHSEWVKTEIRKAHKRERAENKRVLFPVHITSFETLNAWEFFDADSGKDLATEIREYYVPDFSQWKNHDSYQKEFEKLLRDLRI